MSYLCRCRNVAWQWVSMLLQQIARLYYTVCHLELDILWNNFDLDDINPHKIGKDYNFSRIYWYYMYVRSTRIFSISTWSVHFLQIGGMKWNVPVIFSMSLLSSVKHLVGPHRVLQHCFSTIYLELMFIHLFLSRRSVHALADNYKKFIFSLFCTTEGTWHTLNIKSCVIIT